MSSVLILSLAACTKKEQGGTDGGISKGRLYEDSYSPSGRYSEYVEAVKSTGSKVYFDFDSNRLSDEAKILLNELALYMNENQGRRFMIEGHCDIRGEQSYNIALGYNRASAVVEYLKNRGIDGSRLVAISRGKEEPEFLGSTPEAHAKNRRARIIELRPEEN
ncbi:Peptidoglycan-associated lipoprotein Pal [Candidatus Cyrtobacter comes]|uniref:Peptidoglycan-associated lipoprotein Pal n=2 Tax=Candidatus Cyrtobacter comes TaxID=675776 RepID=A0ABU5L8S5_9RICK|nr:Peptidoglycan-associated lipoprotein Pal [Candidatus Cyrtobacter comes]